MDIKIIKHRIRYFFRRVSRLFSFLPIIWRTHDYDYDYSLQLFEYQIKRTADLFEKNNTRKKESGRIRTLLMLMENTRQEKYGMEYHEKLEKIYGTGVLDFKMVPSERNPNHFVLKFNYESWENCQEVHNEYLRLSHESQLKQRKAEALIWKFISHNIYTWWD